jgi:4-hydroxy 2-oxovalerate aldolase
LTTQTILHSQYAGDVAAVGKLTVLDCTFRDGGYYNNWEFDSELTRQYLQVMSDSKVDVVEIGFRLLPKSTFRGPFFYSTDDYLTSLSLPEGPQYGVMINAGEVIDWAADSADTIRQLFSKAVDSRISLVRIAAHFRDVEYLSPVIAALKELGYQIVVNLMQAAGRSESDLESAVKAIDAMKAVSVLYFADSLGNMDPQEVKRIASAIFNHWSGAVGFHAHNNRGYALMNALMAIEAGVTWIDGTVLGMGRGAGNVATERLLLELPGAFSSQYKAEAIFSLVIDRFEALRQKYNWGPSLLYHVAANYNIHPTYIQQIIADNRYSTDQIIAALDFLKESDTQFFSPSVLQEASETQAKGPNQIATQGTWDASNWCADREVLIIAPGPKSEPHLEAVASAARKRNWLVLVLNCNSKVAVDIVTAYVASNKSRVMIEARSYSQLARPLIIPKANFGEQLGDSLKDVEVWDYGLNVQASCFEVDSHSCQLYTPLVAFYALALATAGNASTIYLAGFDGYSVGTQSRNEMTQVFDSYQSKYPNRRLISLTPTNYPVEEGSVYAPFLPAN